MRFPWVARSAYEDVREQLKDERERTRYLMDLVADMKVSGGSVTRPVTGRSLARAPKASSAIDQAIDESPIASSDPFARRRLRAWAAQQERLNVDQAEILDRLRNWYSVQPSDDDEDEDVA